LLRCRRSVGGDAAELLHQLIGLDNVVVDVFIAVSGLRKLLDAVNTNVRETNTAMPYVVEEC
jgi:hypothetical protein